MLVIQMHMLMETEYYLMKSKSILSLCLYKKFESHQKNKKAIHGETLAIK
jgi:hypothetical protein